MRDIELEQPYTISYKGIYVVCDRNNRYAEIIEHPRCYGGASWARYHYSNSPLILQVNTIGDMTRYYTKIGTSNLELKPSAFAAGIESVTVKNDKVEITYAGLGGGGVGATKCRAYADGVISYDITESGGGRSAKGKIIVPRRERLIIGIDDTDTKEKGATWTLTHNIADALNCSESVYLSHSIVQLYPVSSKTQNCVSTVLEFGCVDENAKNKILQEIKSALLKYSVSDKTGMVAFSGFDAVDIYNYSKMCRSGEVSKDFAMQYAREHGVEIWLDGEGVIGALAALPWFAKPDESIKLDTGLQ
ncbi:methanogenesis marker protein 11 [Methanohalobium evestigatum Z-7303]|uniref:Methanogenesis marker protein 11 n=1 Tax=Methanohalobium evestigatum (strain ATCC BAA-1072 / DSM 3721 / NBRC 107634 / OCM 161 / Z-7303) TaxID=644295 RepID=D7E8E6_METEZ|nr:methanogenesis marker protein 11 [Methanohalobium evestigatum]ADI73488.1 methanogenesis marker protein 11 [Methanohalobium evestigatum Z-7303]